MAFLSVIRRWALREGMSIREIARRTGLSRNTIRKYLRNGTTEPSFKVPDRPSKLDPYAEKLSGWLLTESRKPRKQRRTIKQLHRELVVLGYSPGTKEVSSVHAPVQANWIVPLQALFAIPAAFGLAQAQSPRHWTMAVARLQI